MRRRDFLGVLGGAAASWPVVARAQQVEGMQRIGVLMNLSADDPEGPPRIAAFVQALQQLGRTVGRNIQIDYRWGAGDADLYRKYADELVSLGPDVTVASNTSSVRALQRATRTTPIVFASAVDPVGGGLVASLARPGGNVTGFAAFEFGMSGKWLELLKEIAPRVTGVAILRDSATTGGTGQFGAIQAVAPAFGIEVSPVDIHDAGEIERVVTSFARRPDGGMVVTSGALAGVHRDLIIKLAAQHRLPAVYPFRFFVARGGLISYGPARIDPWLRAASYVDRILKGERPADLPVQKPIKYELAINLKTAKTLGLTVPPTLLARADEAIE
jgi:putative tryptophan/tyrosine transport system substrate-binding protein